MLGFKKHKSVQEEDRPLLKYYWRGRKEDYIARELDFSEKHLAALIARAADYRADLLDHRAKLDAHFETTIFQALPVPPAALPVQEVHRRIATSLAFAKEVVNRCQTTTKDLVRGIETNLDTEISLLRLLVFRQTETHEE